MHYKMRLKTVISSGMMVAGLFGISTFHTGCTKTKSSSPTPAATDTLPSATIATSLTQMIAGSGGGIAPQAEASAQMYQNLGFTCGQVLDTTLAGLNTGGGMTLKYNLTYSDTAFCTSGALSKIDFSYSGIMDMSMTSLYMGTKMSTFMSMGGLDAASSSFVVNETCSASDTVKETAPQVMNTYINMVYAASNINISKSTNMIVSGHATINYSYTTTSGNTYSESATVTYNGNSRGTITLANGNSYIFSW